MSKTSSSTEEEFQRRGVEKYSDEHFELVAKLEEAYEDKLVFMPNKDGIYCYYRGLCLLQIRAKKVRLFSKTTKTTAQPPGENARNKFLEELKAAASDTERINMLCKRKKEVEDFMQNSMQGDKERCSEQIITYNNLKPTDEEGKYSVCGMEMTIPQKYIGKSAEIDMVIINANAKKMFLVEFKCGKDTCFDNAKNISVHCKDYIDVVLNANEIGLVHEMLKAYNVQRRLYGLAPVDQNEEYELNILFLLTKKPCEAKNSKLSDNMDEESFDKARRLVEEVHQNAPSNRPKIYFYCADAPEDVVFDENNFEELLPSAY